MQRFRRLRRNQAVRKMVAETRLDVRDLIYPLFVIEGENILEEIESMPGIHRYSLDRIDEILDQVSHSGILGILLFGIPEHKDSVGSEAYNPKGIVQRTICHIKKKYPELIIIADVCLCEYTDHGHCGIIHEEEILNDETLPYLADMAVSMAGAGADMIAPSDMMDGDILAIRDKLDRAGFKQLPIMGYSAKFASGYYAPFRDAADSCPHFGDRKSYQMDVRNGREAIRELANDIEMGADILMVKPALAYLDIVKEASRLYDLPIAVYNVSGEYAMVKAAAAMGYIDEKKIILENLIAMKRAGAGIIITYHALEAAGWIRDGRG